MIKTFNNNNNNNNNNNYNNNKERWYCKHSRSSKLSDIKSNSIDPLMFGDHEPFLSSFDKVHPDGIMLSRLFSRSCMEARPLAFFIPFIRIS